MAIEIEITEQEVYSDKSVTQLVRLTQAPLTLLDVLELKVLDALDQSDALSFTDEHQHQQYVCDTVEALKNEFKHNKLILFVNDAQVETLEEAIELSEAMVMSFSPRLNYCVNALR